jgi:hypothetical protein
MSDLRFRMIMALNAIDLGNPLAEEVASVCAEIAEQYCAALHVVLEVEQIIIGRDPFAGSGRITAADAGASAEIPA